jgi:hypothetical protein
MATGAYYGNPNIQRQGEKARQIAQQRNVSDIADPRTYGFMQGLFGTAPDQLGYSVFDDPATKQAAQKAAEVGFVGGGLLSSLPIVGQIVKGAKSLPAMIGKMGSTSLPAKSTSSIQALELAQQRAALPVEQGGLGLPKNNTPEMRANAMGFDINLFHGTSGDFLLFDPFNPIFATEVADIANLYAGKGLSANVMPLKFRGKELTVSDLNQDGKSGYFAENLAKKLGLYKEGDKLNLSDIQERELINELSKYGIDRLKITNMGDMGGSQTQYVLPARSDNVRSRFAAFDPFRKDVATATAMGVALPDLLAQPLSPMYTDPFGNTIGSSIR